MCLEKGMEKFCSISEKKYLKLFFTIFLNVRSPEY